MNTVANISTQIRSYQAALHLIGVGSRGVLMACVGALSVLLSGCGTTKSYTATEQLLLSDAVDSTITKIDFRPLTGRKIYVDTKFAEEAGKPRSGTSTFVNADYVISAVRQQLVAAGCMLVDKRDDCELVLELRVGALGSDQHSILYGMPASNIGQAASVINGAAAIPTLPEIALAKKELKSAAAKIALFAYDRETLEPYWQSGIAQAGANARDSWFMGIGPYQSGTIYAAPRFAGRRIKNLFTPNYAPTPTTEPPINGVNHREAYVFESKPKQQAVENIATDSTASGTPAIPASTTQPTPAQLP